MFWWPLFGTSFDDAPLPLVERGWWSLPLEVIGIVICVWLWRNNDLGSAERRSEFLRNGQLDAVPERFA